MEESPRDEALVLEDPEICGIPAELSPPLKPSVPISLPTPDLPLQPDPNSVDLSPSVTLVDLPDIQDDHFPRPSPPSSQAAAAPQTGGEGWEVLERPEEERSLSVESAIERVLLLVLDPAIGGLPGVQSAESRASELLLRTEGDVEKAIRLVSDDEINFHRKQLIIEFLLKQSVLPFFLGLPFSFLLNTFINIRAVAVVARLYGHKLNHPRTRHEILLCLLPQGPTSSSSSPSASSAGEGEEGLRQTAKSVARAMAGPLLGRATGISMAGDILALGSDLVNTAGGGGGGGEFNVVGVTPVMTARHYFCPEVTSEWLRVEVGLLVVGMVLPTLLNANLKVYFGLINVAIMAVAGAEKLNIPRAKLSGAGVLLFFVVYSLLPLLNFISSFSLVHRAFIHNESHLNLINRVSILALGVLNFIINVTRQYHTEPSKFERTFAYARLGLATLVIPQFIAADEQSEHYRASLFFSMWFLSALLSSFCQQRFLQILKRREAFLKLLGAERVLTLSLTLLLKGLTRNVTDELRKFLEAMTPSPAVVCALHAVKLHALEMATLLSAIPKISDLLLPGSINFYLGLAGGVAVLGLMVREWTERDYTSNNRIFLIMPGEIDAKVKELLTNTGSKAARMVFFSVIRAMFTSLVRKFTALNIQ